MTDLLTRRTPETAPESALRGRVRRRPGLRLRRPPVRRQPRTGWSGAAVAAVSAALSGLGACVLLVVLGWVGSGAAAAGSVSDAVRAGVVGWLVGHGSGVRTGAADVTAVPLGLTLLLGVIAFAGARRVRVGSRRRAGLAPRTGGEAAGWVACFATAYTGVVLGVVAGGWLLGVSVHPVRTLLVAWVLAAVAGALGLVGPRTGTDRAYRTLPFGLLAVLRGALAGCCVMLAGTGAVFLGALLSSVGGFADLVSALDPTWPGALLLLATFVLALPNLLGLTGSVLLGPGFALGSGTTVTATSVTLGSVPGWPPLAALPGSGPTPGWAVGLLAVPVLAGVVAGWLAAASSPGGSVRRGGAAVAAGVLSGSLVGGWVLASGGAVGPGRMADVGAAWACVPVAVATLGAGALIGGCAQLLVGARGGR